MPELPEVETVRRRVEPVLVGRTFEHVDIHDPRLVRPHEPAEVAAELSGERVDAVERRGKYLIVRFETGRVLLVHLRMTGSLSHGRRGSLGDDPHRRAVVRLENGSDVAYRDVRRFGTWLLLEPGEFAPYIDTRVGPEPLGPGFTTAFLATTSRRPGRAPEGRDTRPAHGRRAREHLRRRVALARTPPSAAAGRRADRGRGRRAAAGDPGGTTARDRAAGSGSR